MAEFHCSGYTLVDNERLVKNVSRQSLPSSEEEMKAEEEFLVELSRYVEDRLQAEFSMIPIPIPDTDSPVKTTILATSNWTTAAKILVVVQNSSGSILGIFSRTLCKKEGISHGSIIPFVQRAVTEGYAVIILRPNTNSIVEHDPITHRIVSKLPIIGSESPEIHVLYVLENILPQAENATHIALLGYGNGASLCKYMVSRQIVRSKEDGHSEVNRIRALITIEASHIIEEDDPADVKELIDRIAINLECDSVPRGYKLGISSRKLGCKCISLGLPRGEAEIQNVASSIYLAIDPVFEYMRLAESVEDVSQAFAIHMAQTNGHDPATAESEGTVNIASLPPQVTAAIGPPPTNRRGSVVPGGNFFTKLFGGSAVESASPVVTTKKSDTRTKREGEEDKLTVSDFDLLKVVGQGAFGKVRQIKTTTTTTTLCLPGVCMDYG